MFHFSGVGLSLHLAFAERNSHPILVWASLIDPGGQWFEGGSSSLSRRELATRSVAKDYPLRILCLGASITYGFHSTSGNGFRYALRGKLVEQGNDVNMIGSLKGGNMSNNHVEGWKGFRISQVAQKAELSLPSMPNLVLLLAGSKSSLSNNAIEEVKDRV